MIVIDCWKVPAGVPTGTLTAKYIVLDVGLPSVGAGRAIAVFEDTAFVGFRGDDVAPQRVFVPPNVFDAYTQFPA